MSAADDYRERHKRVLGTLAIKKAIAFYLSRPNVESAEYDDSGVSLFIDVEGSKGLTATVVPVPKGDRP